MSVISRAIYFCFQELSLVGLGFSVVPSEVWESSEVTKLDLSKNSIEELPVELSSCVSIEVYDLVFHPQHEEWGCSIFLFVG